MRNTHWLEHVHGKLMERGLVRELFVLWENAVESPLSFAERNDVPLISSKDLLFDDARVTGNARVAESYRRNILEPKLEDNAPLDMFTYLLLDNKDRYLDLWLERHIISRPFSDGKEYVATTTSAFEYYEDQRRTRLSMIITFGENFSALNGPPLLSEPSSGDPYENFLRDCYHSSNLDRKLPTSPFNHLGPQEAVNEFIDLVVHLNDRG